MISQRCPKCRSSRIRRGYKPTPFVMRVFGVYRLLCDNCNLQFTGFAVPGTVSKRGRHRKNHQRSQGDSQPTRPATQTSSTEAK
ncbi:MAG: hypothetical protein H0V27_02860 [Pyrinomonadaceae bacterium]|nr:hypothetical protein [Pyrinomonadaceae bacterium]